MKVVTVEQMRSIERAADSGGLSYATMMEAAGRAVAAWVERQGGADQRVLVLVGPGNNGGDGLVAARWLHEAGASVALYCWKRETEGDENWNLAESAGVPVLWASDDKRYARLRRLVTQTDWILDALLGTGVARPIGGALQELLAVVGKGVAKRKGGEGADTFTYLRPMAWKQAVDSAPIVVAVDAPTGLNCDTGGLDPATVPADVTVTFGFPKVGQFLFPGAAYVGELVIADIGIPAKLSREVDLEVNTPAQIRGLLPKRPADAHKGTFGKVMVVAGSVNYTGAAYLAASAATRAGAGLVTLGVAQNLHSILAHKLSEATFLLLPHEMGALVPEATKVLQESLGAYDALLLGPGLGRDKKTVEFVARLLALPPVEEKARLGFLGAAASGSQDSHWQLPPLIVDADGLNALADTRGWAEFLSCPAVLTPHPGEMARLLGTTINEVEADRIGIARRAAQEWKTVVVLKGAYTLICSPRGRVSINPFADATLATAGTGDVLAGTIAGLLGQGLSPFDAAVAGAYLHGLAGHMVRNEIGPSGAVASDLLVKLPLAMRRLADPRSGSR
ncbi:MAG TPA: NAD(P)H-hydrate dehydratase [Anaerolineae bacterium]|nr:NAD(P)H-hydrate dehydratase [Anaerolineae bacterium]